MSLFSLVGVHPAGAYVEHGLPGGLVGARVGTRAVPVPLPDRRFYPDAQGVQPRLHGCIPQLPRCDLSRTVEAS